MANVWDGTKFIDDQTGNTYDPNEGIWRDPKTGNYQVNGVWTNPQGQTWNGTSWTTPGQQGPQVASSMMAGGQPTTTGFQQPGLTQTPQSATALQLNPGQPLQQTQLEQGGLDYRQQQSIQAAQIEADKQRQFQEQQAQIDQQFQAQQAQLERTSKENLDAANRALQEKLQNNEITSQQYMQSLDLAQKESQYARDLALRTLQSDRDNAVQQAQLSINKAAEVRQERLQQAQLDANPADFVASQFYKRNGAAQNSWDLAQQFAAGGTATPSQPASASGSQVQTPSEAASGGSDTLYGENYAPAAPAYSDSTIQSVVNAFNGSNKGGSPAPLYNPGLSGTGAFGVNINSPGSISRSAYGNMTDAEKGVLTSFLNAGVSTGNGGQRAQIDPDEYFTQIQKSFIPTLSGVSGVTQYS